MPKFDVTARSDDGRHLLSWRGVTVDEMKNITTFFEGGKDLPEPVARKRKAVVKAKKEKAA